MPNIASLLKQEIARVARREARAETEKLKRASTQHRLQIAALKREVASLQQLVAQRAKSQMSTASPDDAIKVRFSPTRLKKHRERLELSAEKFGKLFGVTAQTVYNWENGARPDKHHLPAISQLRRLTKRQAHSLVATRN